MHPYVAEQLIADRQAQALADAHHSRLVRAAAATRPHRARGWHHRLLTGVRAISARLTGDGTATHEVDEGLVNHARP